MNPSWLLAAATSLLPPRRAEWGRAMRAELAQIDPARARWRFALSCAASVVRAPATLLSWAGVLAWAAAAGVAAVCAAGIDYVPLRVESLGLLAVMAAGTALGRLWFGADRGSRIVRALGHLAIGALALGLVSTYRFQPRIDPLEQASTGMPILSVAVLAYLAGLTAVTGSRSGIGGRTVARAGLMAMAAVAVCFAPMAWTATVPQSASWTLLLMIVAGATTWFLVPDRAGAVVAAAAAGLLIPLTALALLELVPAAVPDYSQPMLASATAAERLVQSRSQAQDAYVAALLVGAMAAGAAGVAVLVERRVHAESCA